MQKSRLVEIKLHSKEKEYCNSLLSHNVNIIFLFLKGGYLQFLTFLPKENVYLFTVFLS